MNTLTLTQKQNEELTIEKALRKIFGDEGVKDFERMRTSSDSSTWKCTIETSKGLFMHFFIKAKSSGVDAADFVINRLVSNMMYRMHQGKDHHYGMFACSKDGMDAQELKWARDGAIPFPEITSDSVILEIQRFVQGPTLTQILRSRADRKTLRYDDHVLIEQICKSFKKINSVRPATDIGIDNEEKREGAYAHKLNRLYNKAIKNVRERISNHVPHPKECHHPIITEGETDRIEKISEKLIDRWIGRGDRLGALHGDLRTENLILVSTGSEVTDSKIEIPAGTEIVPIDFSRIMWGPRGYDWGRFFMDIVELFCESNCEYYRNFILHATREYAALWEDPELNSESCFGVFSMTLIKVDPLGTPIQNPRVAKKVYDIGMRIAESGTVQVFEA